MQFVEICFYLHVSHLLGSQIVTFSGLEQLNSLASESSGSPCASLHLQVCRFESMTHIDATIRNWVSRTEPQRWSLTRSIGQAGLIAQAELVHSIA